MEEDELFNALCEIRDSCTDKATQAALNILMLKRWGA